MNMKQWINDLKTTEKKNTMPILSFPSTQLLNITVRELISDSRLQAEGMKAIADRTKPLASVSMMDLSVEAEAFGSDVHISDDEVPTVRGSIVTSQKEADNLKIPEVGDGRTSLYVDAVKLACEKITDNPVFAGTIGPFSLAGRLMDVSEIMYMCYDEPDMVHTVLKKCTEFIIKYMLAFKEAGANGVVMAEPLAGLLSPSLMEEFAAPYAKQIADAVQTEDFILIYHNCGNNVIELIDHILTTGAAAYHFGNAIDMEKMMQSIPSDVVAMGNIDPAGQFKDGTVESMEQAVLELLGKCSKYPNFVISSGCDIPPKANWEVIDKYFETVRKFYA